MQRRRRPGAPDAVRPGLGRDAFFDVPYQLVHRAASACRGRAAARLFLDMAAGARPYAFDWNAVILRRAVDCRMTGEG